MEHVTVHPRRIAAHGSFKAAELPRGLMPMGEWRTAEVGYVENSAGTVYLAVRDDKGTTLYPLAPEAVAA